jgi:hypothetical protein
VRQAPRGRLRQKTDGPAANEVLRYVETMLCIKEAKTIGSAAFVAKYGQKDPLGACRTAQQTAAQTLITNARTACATDRTPLLCVKRNLIAAVGPSSEAKGQGDEPKGQSQPGDLGKGSPQPNEPSHGTGSPQLALYVETVLCVKEAKTLGRTAFLAKYGQQDPLRACRAAQQAAAQAIVSTATASCSGNPNPTMCVKRAIMTAVSHPTGAPARP